MARTVIPIQEIGGASTVDIDDITWTPADATNDMEFSNDGNTILLVQNRSTAAARTVDVVGVADYRGRSETRTLTVPQGSAGPPMVPHDAIMGPFPVDAWNQSGSDKVAVDITTATDLFVAAIRLIRVN